MPRRSSGSGDRCEPPVEDRTAPLLVAGGWAGRAKSRLTHRSPTHRGPASVPALGAEMAPGLRTALFLVRAPQCAADVAGVPTLAAVHFQQLALQRQQQNPQLEPRPVMRTLIDVVGQTQTHCWLTRVLGSERKNSPGAASVTMVPLKSSYRLLAISYWLLAVGSDSLTTYDLRLTTGRLAV